MRTPPPPLFLPESSVPPIHSIMPHVPTLCSLVAFFSPLPGKIHRQDEWRRSVRAKDQQVVQPSGSASLKTPPPLSFLLNLSPPSSCCCDLHPGFFFSSLSNPFFFSPAPAVVFPLKTEKDGVGWGFGGWFTCHIMHTGDEISALACQPMTSLMSPW